MGMMEVDGMCSMGDDGPEWNPKELTDLVEKLKTEGVTENDISNFANKNGYDECRYGHSKNMHKIISAIWSPILAVGGVYLAHKTGKYFGLDMVTRGMIDVIGFVFPISLMLGHAQYEENNADNYFYYFLREKKPEEIKQANRA